MAKIALEVGRTYATHGGWMAFVRSKVGLSEHPYDVLHSDAHLDKTGQYLSGKGCMSLKWHSEDGKCPHQEGNLYDIRYEILTADKQIKLNRANGTIVTT